ncbi:MAG: type III-B CRISPR module RAMP protein Cmr1 [Candidatus Xenobia bacterium]
MSNRKELVLQYKVITPIFGGGVKPQQSDPVCAVRVSSVVGHLRFWWRACRGGQFQSVQELREREAELWGDTERQSSIWLTSRSLNQGELAAPFSVVLGHNGKPKLNSFETVAPAYVAFPMQPRFNEMKAGMELPKLRAKVEFELTVSYPSSVEADLKAALWAWDTFGGVGARTRRGFGALQRIKENGQSLNPPANYAELDQSVRKGIQQHVLAGTIEGVTLLPSTEQWKLSSSPKPPNVVWKELVDTYRAFRQDRNPGDGMKQGRSRWPEPDAIRKLTGQAVPKHASPLVDVGKFPRGRFGLPIIFHFKDAGDPDDCTLQGADHDRLASPLIIRPLACGTGALGLALVLNAPVSPPDGWKLKQGGKSWSVSAKLESGAEARKIKALEGSNGLFQAFLSKIKRPGGTL